VVDEVQFTRNNTAQYRAIQTLVKTLVITENESYFAILSASPFDKEAQAVNLMKMVGIIRQEELFRRGHPTGWRELVAYCQEKNPYVTVALLSMRQGKKFDGYAFQLYSEVVREELCSAMPLVIGPKCDAKNGYYKVGPEKKEAFDKALLALKCATCHVKDPIAPRIKGDGNYAQLTMAMVQLETLKISIFARLARKYLEDNASCKVVVGVHYLNTMFTLENELRDFYPLLLHGDMNEDEREDVVEQFQTPSKERRLLLCIARVGGVGISLHDTNGNYPRVMLLSPSFNLIDTHQATGRVYRVGTKSHTIIRTVYPNVGDQERSIHRVLIKKSKVLKAILEVYTRQKVVLPIDYQEEYEN